MKVGVNREHHTYTVHEHTQTHTHEHAHAKLLNKPVQMKQRRVVLVSTGLLADLLQLSLQHYYMPAGIKTSQHMLMW